MAKAFYKKKKGYNNQHPWRRCPTRKYRFSSEAEASLRARFDEARYGREYGWYECHRCDGWHIFSKKGETRDAQAQA